MGGFRKGFDMEVGKRLRQLRKSRGLTQQALADALDSNAQYISQLERGERGLGYDMQQRYCEFFGIQRDKLGMVKDDREEYTPAVQMLIDRIKDLPEAEVFRLLADVEDRFGNMKLIDVRKLIEAGKEP